MDEFENKDVENLDENLTGDILPNQEEPFGEESPEQKPPIECEDTKPKSKSPKYFWVGALGAGVGAVIMAAALLLLQPLLPNSGTIVTTDGSLQKKIEIGKYDSPQVAVAEKTGPSVVGVRATVKTMDFFFGEQESQPQGSGIIIRSDGYILTNNHVIESALSQDPQNRSQILNGAKIEVVLPSQQDKPYTAKVIGRDIKTDLAVLKIDAGSLPAAEFGNSDSIKVGDLVVAIGNPGGLEYMGSVTSGIISGLNRTIPIDDGKELKLIQTDAAINPGNSGGALVNAKGQVIGVNTAKISGQGYEGLGFAIPINKAKEVADSLMNFGYVKGRPLLGISVNPNFTEDVAKANKVPSGVMVDEVSPLSGAYTAGIRRGDIITKFDGNPVKNIDDINKIKQNRKPGDLVDVDIYRHSDTSTKTLKVKLTEELGN